MITHAQLVLDVCARAVGHARARTKSTAIDAREGKTHILALDRDDEGRNKSELSLSLEFWHKVEPNVNKIDPSLASCLGSFLFLCATLSRSCNHVEPPQVFEQNKFLFSCQ